MYSVSRNTRLMLVLLALARAQRPLSEQSLIDEAYVDLPVTKETKERYRRLDIETLESIGVPIIDSPAGLSLDFRTWAQRDPDFTEAEAAAVAAAANVTFTSEELQHLARDGWRKIAPFAQRSSIDDPKKAVILGDPAELKGEDIIALVDAISTRRRVVFSYAPQLGAYYTERTLEPWAIISADSHFFVLGWDNDRRAPRSFRLSRIDDVEVTEINAFEPMPKEDLATVAVKVLGRGTETTEAVIRVKGYLPQEISPYAVEIASATGTGAPSNPASADSIPKHYRLAGVKESDLIRWGLRFAGTIVVESPESARQAIISRLQTVIELHEGAISDEPNSTEARREAGKEAGEADN